ncbi:MAG: hypothetical protein Kow0040_26840 [Thermogutta sp.]
MEGVRLRRRPTLAAATDAPGRPDVVLILQRYPGEHRAADLERLRSRLPLARFASLLGSWCEGEVRSGQPLPGVLRFYWHQWLSSGDEHIRLFREERNRAWSLPPTASDEDLILAEFEQVASTRDRHAKNPEAKQDAPVLLAISRDYAVFEWLRAAARLWGMTAQRRRAGEELVPIPAQTAAVVIDLECDGKPRLPRLGLRRTKTGGTTRPPIVLLAGYPRLREVKHYLRTGATAVLSKPCSLRDLERIVVAQLQDDAA